MLGKTLAEEQQEALSGLMEKSGQPSQSPSEDKGAPKPSAPASPSRSDARSAMREGRFPAYVAYWEALGYSRNRIIQASEIGRGTFYKYMGQETRSHELRL